MAETNKRKLQATVQFVSKSGVQLFECENKFLVENQDHTDSSSASPFIIIITTIILYSIDDAKMKSQVSYGNYTKNAAFDKRNNGLQ